jgi:hypothetical protein
MLLTRVKFAAVVLTAAVTSVRLGAAQTGASASQDATTEAPAQDASQGATEDAARAWMARAKDPAVDARFKVRIMEGVLERAVEQAAKSMNQQLRTVSPELVLLTGAAQARGYRLDGYGLFFDVQVPAALRQSMGWTVRMMRQNSANLEQALGTFKRLAENLQGKARADAELAVRQIELQVRPPQFAPDFQTPILGSASQTGASQTGASQGGASLSGASLGGAAGPAASSSPASSSPASSSPGSMNPAPSNLAPPSAPPSDTVQAASTPATESFAAAAGTPTPWVPSALADVNATPAPPPSPPINPLLIQNPDLAYELEVREALISAMLEWGVTLPLQPTEWLTVAARDNEDVVIPGEAADVVTIIMRVKGSDLAEFRAGRLTGADIRRRVEVREF